jgi:phospholipid/cholesterol/gamma-HCH transport system substrate-binding protein
MNESPNKRAVMVGLFVFIGLAFLIGGILMVGNLHQTFTRKMQVVALFDDVGGLQAGNNVWFSGVKIGTVRSLHFHKESQVEVIINIEVKAQEYIRKNAKIKTGTDGLIGNKILIVYGGTTRVRQIESGDTLMVEKTFSQEDMINTFQESNKNLSAITHDLKGISKTMAGGEGTIGKLLNNESVYENIDAATTTLRDASVKADHLLRSLNEFTAGLNTKGNLANELVTDTVIFQSLKSSAGQLKQLTDTAAVLMTSLKMAEKNPNTPVGVLLHDEETGQRLKSMIRNLESSSMKLDEDLEAAQHNFLLRGYFKKKSKAKNDSIKNVEARR